MCSLCGNPAHVDLLLGDQPPFKGWEWRSQSLALYDDGVITYSAPKGRFRKTFRKLERKTGLNFERLKGADAIGEIHCVYQPISYAAGLANRKPEIEGASFLLTVDPIYKGRRTEAHEIGHALGLSHNQHRRSVMNTDWGSFPGPFFSKYDVNNIATVFEDFL